MSGLLMMGASLSAGYRRPVLFERLELLIDRPPQAN
jgi:hypothetical protein